MNLPHAHSVFPLFWFENLLVHLHTQFSMESIVLRTGRVSSLHGIKQPEVQFFQWKDRRNIDHEEVGWTTEACADKVSGPCTND